MAMHHALHTRDDIDGLSVSSKREKRVARNDSSRQGFENNIKTKSKLSLITTADYSIGDFVLTENQQNLATDMWVKTTVWIFQEQNLLRLRAKKVGHCYESDILGENLKLC